MAALVNATTGYSTVADLAAIAPQPDNDPAGAALEVPSSYVAFLWPQFGMLAQGALIQEFTNISSLEQWGVLS